MGICICVYLLISVLIFNGGGCMEYLILRLMVFFKKKFMPVKAVCHGIYLSVNLFRSILLSDIIFYFIF